MCFVRLLAATVVLATTGLLFANVRDVPAGSADDPPVRVKKDDASAPAPCRPRRVGELLARVFSAAARADAAGIRSSLAPATKFEWYSLTTVSGERRLRHIVRRNPRSAAKLLAERSRRAGERIRLVALEMSYEQRRNIAHIGQLFRYRARDAAAGRWRTGHGKGAIDCGSGGLMVWSAVAEVGARSQGGHHRFCGERAEGLLRRRDVTVCQRP